MHSCIYSLQSMRRSVGLYYFILRLPVRPFSGLVCEKDPPPVNLPTFWHGWISALGFLVFTRYVVQHLGYYISLDYHLCPIWKISQGIRSVPEGPFYCFIFLTFSEGAPNWSDEIEGYFYATWY